MTGRWPAVMMIAIAGACGGGGGDGADARPPDTGPPSVVYAMPADGATEVAATTAVTAFFGELIDPTTVTAQSFTLADDRGAAVTATVAAWPTGAVLMPDAPLAADRTYTATVTTAVMDPAGNPLAAAATWSFATHQRAWTSAGPIEPHDLSAFFAEVAMDRSGAAFAVWNQSGSGGAADIWASRYTPAAGWGGPVLVSNHVASSAVVPQIAVDDAGDAIAVWQQTVSLSTFRTDIWANRYTPGGGWGTPQLIETVNLGDATNVAIAIAPTGDAAAVWEQSNGTVTNIAANTFSAATGSWAGRQLIDAGSGNAGAPAVGIDAAGNAIAVWFQSDGTRNNEWANRFTAGSGWGTAQLIENDTSFVSEQQIAVDAGGNAVAIWTANSDIWANRFTAGTGWGTAVLLENTPGQADFPRASIDPHGNAFAVWDQDDGTTHHIVANRYDATAGWGTATSISTDSTGGAYVPRIAFDADGDAVVVYEQLDAGRYNAWSNRYRIGTGWETPSLLEDIGHAQYPVVAESPDGDAVVVWDQDDGVTNSIWASAYR